jgi:hypothetical protein
VERKHRSQMSAEEILFAETLVHSITEWNFAVDHIMDRMAEKKIKKQDAVNTLRYGDVIEVNDKGRVVMRLMKGMMKGTCVVASIHDRVLVTAWFNKGSDNHSTLNKSEYTWKVNVIEYLRRIQ